MQLKKGNLALAKSAGGKHCSCKSSPNPMCNLEIRASWFVGSTHRPMLRKWILLHSLVRDVNQNVTPLSAGETINISHYMLRRSRERKLFSVCCLLFLFFQHVFFFWSLLVLRSFCCAYHLSGVSCGLMVRWGRTVGNRPTCNRKAE